MVTMFQGDGGKYCASPNKWGCGRLLHMKTNCFFKTTGMKEHRSTSAINNSARRLVRTSIMFLALNALSAWVVEH